ncbi:MAG: hypothetical protein IPO53_05330 [Chitinophagaceae bacterium]|nr:hypothetical protein [Chitinophagaceae bacterium]
MINKFIVLVAFLLEGNILLPAQTLRPSLADSYTGPGAYSLHHADVFSFTSNPASLSQLKNISFAVYGERRFLLKELNTYTAVVGIPAHSGNFGIEARYSGYSDYNETQFGIAYGRTLGTKVDIGVQFNYHGIRIKDYGNASAISFETGAVLHLTDKLHTGFHINNPVGGKFGKGQQEKLASVYTIGLGYEASEKFFFSAEIEKEEDGLVTVNAGFQYKFIPQVWVRAGMSSATTSAWIGAGLILKSFRVDLTTRYHPVLGITPGLLFFSIYLPPLLKNSYSQIFL